MNYQSSLLPMAQSAKPGLSYCEAQLSLETLSHNRQMISPSAGALILLLSLAFGPHGLPTVSVSTHLL